jgi:predicted transposase YdaD
MADVDKSWDTLMKLLMEKGAQALASLALPGVQVGDALDKELRVTNIEGDLFLDAYLNHLQIIAHFEFQKKKGTTKTKDGQEKTMDRRMWEYNCAMDIRMGRPVYSVLIYLMPEANLTRSPYVQEIPGTGMGHHFSFLVIKLWEVEREVLKRSGFEVLLPLLPLTKGGNTPQVVEEMASELAARDRSDLLELGLFCAGLVLKKKIDKQWLRERFRDMQSIIEDSWVYQEVIEKGLQQGRQQAFQQAAISVLKARFPELEQFATDIIETINDPQQLQMLIFELSIAPSQERAKELLLSLTSSAE